jgi:hypothetical protein
MTGTHGELEKAERRTADPSATPDFLSRVAASVDCMWFSLGRTTYVVPSESSEAGNPGTLGMTILFGNAKHCFQDELSSRPERTRISCHAALDETACAPFCKGKAHEVHQRHKVPQAIRGSVVEGSAVRPSAFPNSPWVQVIRREA